MKISPKITNRSSGVKRQLRGKDKVSYRSSSKSYNKSLLSSSENDSNNEKRITFSNHGVFFSL